jgi:4-hydroxyphenylacetate 3-monooxygenase
MIRTGDEYRDSIRDGRDVWIDGEKVADVTTHPSFKPIVDARARVYDMAHEDATRNVMSYVDERSGERCPIGSQLPRTKADWHAKRRAVDTVLDDVGGIVTRVGDETVGEMWSLFDGQDMLNEIDPQFSQHIRTHVRRAEIGDPFHVPTRRSSSRRSVTGAAPICRSTPSGSSRTWARAGSRTSAARASRTGCRSRTTHSRAGSTRSTR